MSVERQVAEKYQTTHGVKLREVDAFRTFKVNLSDGTKETVKRSADIEIEAEKQNLLAWYESYFKSLNGGKTKVTSVAAL